MAKIRLNKKCLLPTRTADWAKGSGNGSLKERNAICVTDKYVYGTDGHSLYRISTLGAELNDKDESPRALVDLSDAKLLEKTMPEEVILNPGETEHCVSHGMGLVSQPKDTFIGSILGALDGAYPTRNPRAVITLDIEKLYTAVKTIREFKKDNPDKTNNGKAVTLSIYDDKTAIRFDAYVSKEEYGKEPAQTFDALIIPLRACDQRPKQHRKAGLSNSLEAELNWKAAEEPEGRHFRNEKEI